MFLQDYIHKYYNIKINSLILYSILKSLIVK